MSHTDAQNMSHTDAQNMSHTYVFWIIFYKMMLVIGQMIQMMILIIKIKL